MKKYFIVIPLLMLVVGLNAQNDPMRRLQGASRLGSGMSQGQGDSLKHRTGLEDSITIRFRFLDSTALQGFDSSVTDFTSRFPIPWHHVHLGNFGMASQSLLFSPSFTPGWDHGFHSFDVYNFPVAETKFYTTTRPYSEIAYLLGSRSEQMIQLLHTQNIRPNWNVSVQYRLINAPGFFQNQNTNHNNYRFSSWYQSRNKRYQNFIIVVGNKLQSSENGGIKDNGNYLDSIPFEERSTIPTQLGPNRPGTTDFFRSDISTGSRYTNATYLLRQQYDLGQKDSIVTDSLVIPLFYPRIRLEHTIGYSTYNYRFTDNTPESLYYNRKYAIQDTLLRFFIQDYWKRMINEFSIYQFPDAKNPQQFIKVGAALENLHGQFDTGLTTTKDYNFFLSGEYRNKTRNKKWDIEAFGRFYANGLNAGDYNAFISLRRFISKQIGFLQVGFQNVNRTPSFVFDQMSSFYLGTPASFNKENTTNIFGSLEQPHRKLKLRGSYYLVSNYTYYRNYHQADQASAIFNLVQISGEKQFRLYRKWNLKTWIVLQQKAGNAPVNLPLLFTRNLIGYDGNLGFKNLLISMGLEIRYYTPFKSNGYSPVIGQFFVQDSTTTRLKFPEIAAYAHFRIKSFTAYVRAENLNAYGSGGFNNNNVIIPDYPYPGLQIRLGIFWSFVN
ncbi:MAG: putative porin [Flavitalea sp.]